MEKYRKNYSQDASLIAQKHKKIAIRPVLIFDESNRIISRKEHAIGTLSIDFQETIHGCIRDLYAGMLTVANVQVLSVTNDKIRLLDQNVEDVSNEELATALDVDSLVCMQLQLPQINRQNVRVALKYYLYILLGWYNYVLTLQIYDKRTDKIIWQCEIKDILPAFQKIAKIREIVVQECCTMPYCKVKTRVSL